MTDDAPPPPPTDWQTERPWEDDSLAQFETERDPLDAQLLEQDKRNRLSFKKATGRIITWGCYLLALLLGVGVLFWAFHFLAPSTWGFLKPPQLEKLQSTIFSGTIGAVISILAKNYLKTD